MVHYQDELPIVKTSVYISDKLHHSYNYLSNIFVAETGCTIEHYIIMHKVERIKELIIYEDLSLTTIADKLNYSSLPHMSLQFKKITGISPLLFQDDETQYTCPARKCVNIIRFLANCVIQALGLVLTFAVL